MNTWHHTMTFIVVSKLTLIFSKALVSSVDSCVSLDRYRLLRDVPLALHRLFR